MDVETRIWSEQDGWEIDQSASGAAGAQLVLFFGDRRLFTGTFPHADLRAWYPDADIIGCSSAGEILADEVHDARIVTAALRFAHSRIRVAATTAETPNASFAAGAHLATSLAGPDIRGLMVFSEGVHVNGSALVAGLKSVLGTATPITGGLAGDATRFQETRVACNGPAIPHQIAAIGFYGAALRLGHGSVGGWDSFGPERLITRSEGNILFELDGQPALSLYKRYLGEKADNLPASALLFPLMVRSHNQRESGVVRTILGVDERNQSLTFAGDMVQGHLAQLMRANFERLLDGADAAAGFAGAAHSRCPDLSILISCVGRKMILGQRIADEVEAVGYRLGGSSRQVGFYSYGEISPHVHTGACELHNQTMTVTTLSEN